MAENHETGKHGAGVKDDAVYEALRKDGASPQKAARIANAKAAGTLQQRGSELDERSKADLLAEARKIGVAGSWRMNKGELAAAIRVS